MKRRRQSEVIGESEDDDNNSDFAFNDSEAEVISEPPLKRRRRRRRQPITSKTTSTNNKQESCDDDDNTSNEPLGTETTNPSPRRSPRLRRDSNTSSTTSSTIANTASSSSQSSTTSPFTVARRTRTATKASARSSTASKRSAISRQPKVVTKVAVRPSPPPLSPVDNGDDDEDEDDDDDEMELPQWSCNKVRTKIRELLITPGFKVTYWLKEIKVNSNSYGRFMRLKGAWNGMRNQTYYGALRYFVKKEKKQKLKNKRKSAAQKKKDAVKKKTATQRKKEEMERVIRMIKEVEDDGYDEATPIYDDCNDVRKAIVAFLKRGIMSKSRFLKEIGNVQSNQYTSFASMGPLPLSGASNQIYPKAFRWLDKLRIAEGVKKSKKRLKNEKEKPEGFPLRHDNGMRWMPMAAVRRGGWR